MNGLELRKKRQALNLSQAALAKAAGVSRATIERWENERFYPSPLAEQAVGKAIEELEVADH